MVVYNNHCYPGKSESADFSREVHYNNILFFPILVSTRRWERLVGGSTSTLVEVPGSTTGSLCCGTWAVRDVRMVVEGYPPDECLQWDETTHITSL